jgi:hypothetical protein
MQEEITFEDDKTLDLALDIYSYNQKVNISDVSDQQKTKLRDAVICVCRVLDIKLEDE